MQLEEIYFTFWKWIDK